MSEMAHTPGSSERQPSPLTLYRPSTTVLLLLGVILLVSSWPFLEALVWLWSWWLNSPEYSHGIIIPPLAATLIWIRRDQLAREPMTGSWLGFALVVCAGIVYWVGRLATLHIVDNIGYWLLLVGIALALLGPRGFRVVRAPLLMLLLAIPLPQFFLANISSTLQLWSSQLGVGIIRLAGISVLLQGNVIDLGPYKLEVAQACSGLRYLFPLLTLGVLMGYLYHGAMWKRVLIAVLSLPLTLLVNSLRIGLIGIMVDSWGPSLAEGFVHDFQGWAMFMLTGALMMGILVLLHRHGNNGVSWREAFGIPMPLEVPAGTPVHVVGPSRPFAGAAVAVAAIAVVGAWAPAVKDYVPQRQAFVTFPDHLSGWTGHRQGLDAASLEVLQLDDYLMSDYTKPGSGVVEIYIAYYNAQRTGQSVHSPRSCLPGGGWVMTDFGQRDVAGVSFAGAPLRVNRAIVELGKDRELVYYWFQQRGRANTNEFVVKWYLMVDGLLRHRTDGALVRLVTPLRTGEDVATADARLTGVMSSLLPVLPEYVPN